MKILFITGDTLAPWAITFRANELKKRFVNDQVDIISDFKGDPDQYDIIHILYSGYLFPYYHLVMENPHKVFTSIVSASTLQFFFDNAEVLKDIFRNSKKVVCLNLKLKQELIALIGPKYEHKAVYIPNGVDEKLFNRPFTVGFVGSNKNHEYKGLPLIKEACERLGVKLLVQECNYPDLVMPREEMPKFYNRIDCLCLASLGEGTNNPTLEALSMNKPVISTDTGIASMLPGVILVERTVESIMEGISKLNYRQHIVTHLTWDKIAEKYHSLYND